MLKTDNRKNKPSYLEIINIAKSGAELQLEKRQSVATFKRLATTLCNEQKKSLEPCVSPGQ